jgi:MFS family permease
LLAVVTAAVIVFVGEPKRELRSSSRHEGFFKGFSYVVREPAVRKLLVVFFAFHVAYQSVWTFLPLRVQDLVSDSLVGRWSGAAALGDALGIALGASVPGTLVAGVCAIAAAATLLQILVGGPEALVGLRFIVGLCYGGAVVLMRTALGHVAHPERRGVTFGMAQSAFAGGFSVGALVGSAIIGVYGLVAAFLLSACAFGFVAAWSLVAFAPERP